MAAALSAGPFRSIDSMKSIPLQLLWFELLKKEKNSGVVFIDQRENEWLNLMEWELAGLKTHNQLLRNLKKWNFFNGGGSQMKLIPSIQSIKNKWKTFLFNWIHWMEFHFIWWMKIKKYYNSMDNTDHTGWKLEEMKNF